MSCHLVKFRCSLSINVKKPYFLRDKAFLYTYPSDLMLVRVNAISSRAHKN